MKIEFYCAEDEQKMVVATVSWDGHDIDVSAEDEDVRDTLAHAFRRTPLAVDDPSLRRLGTSGAVLLQPGSLEWFRAVARYRATEESGLAARSVPGVLGGGWDPAANYRTFDEQMELLDAGSRG